MQGTVWLTGMLPFILIASAAITAPLAALLLWLYRRAVLRSMARAAGGAPPVRDVVAASEAPGPPLEVRTVGPHVPAPATQWYRRGRLALRRLAVAHAGGALAYAAVFTAVWTIRVTPDGFIPLRALWIEAVYAWPAVIVLGLVTATSRSGRLAIAGGYAVVLLAIGLWALARNPDLPPAELAVFWLTTNGPATALVLAFLGRRVRAVGPLVLAFVTAGVTGALLLVQLLGLDEGVLRRVAGIGFAAGLGGTGVFVALHLIGFVAFAFLGWFALRVLARRYQRRLLSDQTLVAWAVVAVFAVAQSIPLVFSGWALVLTGPVAFAAWVAVARAGMARLVRPLAPAHGPTLLLLRVFALGARSQRLFDALSMRWLRSGGIALIAGPDLVTATVEPHEFLDFVAGRLSRQFVRGSSDLDRRLAALDPSPDRDGRFRTAEFFCHADTWQETMRRLAARCDAVLMDLRGFAPANAGCLYEIGRLLDAVPLGRVIFLTDATTDTAFLRSAFDRLWRSVPADSPNRLLAEPRTLVFEAERAAAREVDALLRLLLAAAPAGEPTAAGEAAACASAEGSPGGQAAPA